MRRFSTRNAGLTLLIVLSAAQVNSDARKNSTISIHWGGTSQWWTKASAHLAAKQTGLGYSVDPEARMSSASIISFRGYPVRTYSVTTDDGYILELHRIPFGKSSSGDSSIRRRVVFLQHGLLNTDAAWLMLPSDQALAFVLADLGYDVWLGNARGNTYSRKHSTKDPSKLDYWKFSVDEMGKYDIPAVINYVLTTTGQSSLSYIGHSMGCAMFFIAMTYYPALNSKIDVMIALAPATANGNSKTLIRYQAPFVNQLVAFYDATGTTVYQAVDSPQHNFQKMYCGPNLVLRNTLCRNYVFTITADDYSGIDLNLLPVIDGHFPSGTSIRTMAFFAQNYNARQTFQAYDFGSSGNQDRYGQSKPLVYDLSRVACPVYLFWGLNDKAVAPDDVAWLAARLGNLKKSIQVEDSNWNHGAHLFSKNAKTLVYDRLIPLLPSTPY